ncbi:MAG: aspartate/glutamate racemase family protein, partial [Melioribacteraceae bacterium]|nr:aspartate/glutamate racemase family protein [Melioribacteraceae bacterium]
DNLREQFDIPIIGMIEPGSKYALSKTKNGKIGVIGTHSTINNEAYSRKLKQLNGNVEVFEKACPLFVPLAEEGWTGHRATELIAEEYLEELIKKEIDTLVLGCTHYPVLTEIIQKIMGPKVMLVDSGTAAALEVETYLSGIGLRNDSNQIGKHQYYVSDLPNKFKTIAERFLGTELDHIEKIDIDQLVKD